ncbi:MAG: hypothetical protein AAGB11_11360 [Pseudomonadota bacterium]
MNTDQWSEFAHPSAGAAPMNLDVTWPHHGDNNEGPPWPATRGGSKAQAHTYGAGKFDDPRYGRESKRRWHAQAFERRHMVAPWR